jgi:O-antigen/teichoic acid export membrane protein
MQPTNTPSAPRRMLLNILSNYAGKVYTLVVWFFLTPFVIHQLGPSDYGLWVLIGSVAAYGGLLEFGIANAITKYVAEFLVLDEQEQAGRLIATALWLYIGLGLGLVVLSASLAPWLPSLFDLSPEQRARAASLLVLSGVAVGISLPSTTTYGILRGLQRYDMINLVSVLGTSCAVAGTVAALLLKTGVIGITAITIPITIAMQLLSIYLIKRAAPQLRWSLAQADHRLVRTVFSFSAALFVINIAGQVQTKTDEIVIGAALPVSSVTPYAIAGRQSGLPQLLTDQFMKVLMPLASQLNAADDRHGLRLLYLNSTRLTLAIAVPLVCGLVVLSRPFLAVWVGPDYAGAAPLVTLLAIASLFNTSLWPAGNILQGMARHRPLALFAIGSALANLLLSIWLVHPLGVAGVALGTLIPTSIECVCFMTPYAMRQNAVSPRVFLSQILWPSLTPALPMLAVLYALRELLQPSSYPSIGLIGLAGVAVYGLLYLALSRGKPEQALLRRLVIQAFTQAATRAGAARKDTSEVND